ncbi:NAD(P)-binding protein [Mycena rosella]|uniref:NAD(P)-binding protein n=1 Tax=Mycena rosella TaxID=1033263 RepID=A0AAD7G8I8_MYCRO|nr:NAD(P)-binding protein [Mycena rosella]
MSTYKSFAVVGGGTIGLPIVHALAAQHVSVVLLSRPESSTKSVPPGVQVAKVDYNDAQAVAAVFKEHKVDVVLATLGSRAIDAQKPLVEAAKLAAVKLFAPSEYGMATDGYTEGVLGDKKQIADDLKAAGIPSVRFYTGMFTEGIPRLVGYPEHGKVRIVGKGEVPVSWTSIPDIAGFVAHVLTTLPPSELENRGFRIEGDRTTMNELGALFKTSVEHVDHITGEGGEFTTFLLTVLESGAGSTGWNETTKSEGSGSAAAGSANALWPGHKWQTIKEVLNL